MPDGEGTIVGNILSRLAAGALSAGGSALEGLEFLLTGGGTPGASGLDPRGRNYATEAARRALEGASVTSGAVEALRSASQELDVPGGGFLAGTVPRAAGSVLPFLLSGPAAPITGIAAGAGEGLEEARRSGATAGEASLLAGAFGAVGASEAVPVLRALTRGRMGRTLIGSLTAGAVEETAQEAFSTLSQNALAGAILDDDRDLLDGLGEAAGAGGVVGGLLNLAVGSLPGSRRARRIERFIEEVTARPSPPGDVPSVGDATSPGDETSPSGRPDLASPTTSEAVRQLNDLADEARLGRGEPAPETQAEWNARADALIESDYEAQRDRFLQGKLNLGENPVHVKIAQRVTDREGLKALASGDADAIAFYTDFTFENYRQSGTRTARALAARIDPHLSPSERMQRAMVQSVFTPSSRLQKAMDSSREEVRKRAEARHREEILALREALLAQGFDPTDLASFDLENLDNYHWAMRTVSSAKASGADKRYEYWLNSILSGPQTQAANIIGNTLNSAWDLSAQRMAEIGVNLVAGDPNSAQAGELREIGRAFADGRVWQRAFRRAVKAWSREAPSVAEEIGVASRDSGAASKIERGERGAKIGGRGGRFVRAGFGFGGTRLLLAADEMAKSLITDLEVRAQAHRRGKAEGLKGAQLADFITREASTPGSKSFEAAFDKALDLTFQKELGRGGQGALTLRENLPGLRYVFPFVTTPTNIIKTGARKSPLGALRLLYRAGRGTAFHLTGGARGREYTADQKVRDLSEQLIAWGATSLLVGLVDNEDGPIEITGSGASRAERGRRQTEFRTAPPQSIRIGDTWYSYRRIEPFATALSLAVDSIRGLRGSEGSEKDVARMFDAMLGLVRDKTFLRGMGDLLEAVREPEQMVRYSQNFLASWVPNVLKQAGRASDPVYREYSVREQGAEWLRRMATRTVQRAAPLPQLGPPPKVDLWGREIKRGPEGRAPVTDFLVRLMIPVQVQEASSSPVDRLIVRWNTENPQDRFDALVPAPYGEMRGRKYVFTERGYHDFLVRAGTLAHARLEELHRQGRLNSENPSERDIIRIARVLQAVRRKVRGQFVGEAIRAMRDRQSGSEEFISFVEE